MRLTEKDGSYRESILNINLECIGIKEWNNPLTKKLGQLEDIEDELGIDLLKLFNALENGFYRYRPTAINNVICFIAKPKVNMKQKCFTYGSYGKSYFKDYGKTWALTKEELEK